MLIAGLCSVYSVSLPTTILSAAREVTGIQATTLRVPVPHRPRIDIPFVTTTDLTSPVYLHARLKFIPNLLRKGENRFGSGVYVC
ncbi:hypothetical protein BDQ17DRAFT_1363681 [Cyathus striatus]|nr:hypothetical protein BDQ17DRAFT_1373244 [Cyathus striatus]KAF8997084.1 hypothetical protein BDQ17DRAFT_1363681 [Cyathus striatus]